jgi:hypothetical protein
MRLRLVESPGSLILQLTSWASQPLSTDNASAFVRTRPRPTTQTQRCSLQASSVWSRCARSLSSHRATLTPLNRPSTSSVVCAERRTAVVARPRRSALAAVCLVVVAAAATVVAPRTTTRCRFRLCLPACQRCRRLVQRFLSRLLVAVPADRRLPVVRTCLRLPVAPTTALVVPATVAWAMAASQRLLLLLLLRVARTTVPVVRATAATAAWATDASRRLLLLSLPRPQLLSLPRPRHLLPCPLQLLLPPRFLL